MTAQHRAEKMLRGEIAALANKIDGHLGHLDGPNTANRDATLRSIRESLGYPLREATYDELNTVHQMLSDTLDVLKGTA